MKNQIDESKNNKCSVKVMTLIGLLCLLGCNSSGINKDEYIGISDYLKSIIVEEFECDANIIYVTKEINKIIETKENAQKGSSRKIRIRCSKEITNEDVELHELRVKIYKRDVSVLDLLTDITKQTGLHIKTEKNNVILY